MRRGIYQDLTHQMGTCHVRTNLEDGLRFSYVVIYTCLAKEEKGYISFSFFFGWEKDKCYEAIKLMIDFHINVGVLEDQAS